MSTSCYPCSTSICSWSGLRQLAVSCSNAPLKLDLIVIEIINTIKYDILFTVIYCKEKVLETGGSPQEMLEQLWDVLEQEIPIMDVQPTNLQRLYGAVMSMWSKISDECYQHLIESITGRHRFST